MMSLQRAKERIFNESLASYITSCLTLHVTKSQSFASVASALDTVSTLSTKGTETKGVTL